MGTKKDNVLLLSLESYSFINTKSLTFLIFIKISFGPKCILWVNGNVAAAVNIIGNQSGHINTVAPKDGGVNQTIRYFFVSVRVPA